MASETSIRQRSGTGTGWNEALANLDPRRMALRHQLGLVGLLLLILLPLNLFPTQLRKIIPVVYLMMFAMSWDVVSGYTGQLSLGHGAFFLLGGYASAIANIQHGLSPLVSIPIGMVVAGIGGVLIGLPALRLRGPYLSLVTLVVPVILGKLLIVFNNELTLFGIPIAPQGLGGVSGVGLPDPLISTVDSAVLSVGRTTILGKTYTALQMFRLSEYYMSLGVMTLILVVLLAVTRSSAGTVFTAIREDEDAVEAAGLNPTKFKLFAFVLSGITGGLASAVYVHTSVATAQPRVLLGLASVRQSLDVVIMGVLGGTGTIVGAIVGAAFFAVITAIVTGLQFSVPLLGLQFSKLSALVLLGGAMIILFFFPGGLLRGGLRAGRTILAVVRGEDTEAVGGGVDFSDTALGSIVDNYREELDEVSGDDGGRER